MRQRSGPESSREFSLGFLTRPSGLTGLPIGCAASPHLHRLVSRAEIESFANRLVKMSAKTPLARRNALFRPFRYVSLGVGMQSL